MLQQNNLLRVENANLQQQIHQQQVHYDHQLQATLSSMSTTNNNLLVELDEIKQHVLDLEKRIQHLEEQNKFLLNENEVLKQENSLLKQ